MPRHSRPTFRFSTRSALRTACRATCHRRRATRSAIVAQVVLGIVSAVSPATGTYPEVSIEEITDVSDLIFIGTVMGIENDESRSTALPQTTVQLQVRRVIHASTRSVQQFESVVRLRFPGGARGDTVAVVSVVPILRLGKTYLIFTRDDNEAHICPIIAGSQGMFEVDERRDQIRTFSGVPFAVRTSGTGHWVDPGQSMIVGRQPQLRWEKPAGTADQDDLAPSDTPSRNRESGSPMGLSSFLTLLDELLSQPQPYHPRLRFGTEGQYYYTDPAGTLRAEPLVYQVPLAPHSEGRAREHKTKTTSDRSTPLCADGYQGLPFELEQVNPSNWDYQVHADCMADYNRYMSVFSPVAGNGSAGINFTSEIVGFWHDSDLFLAYLRLFDGALAVTLTWKIPLTDEIYEADVVFNAAYSWTDNLDVSRTDPNIILLPSVTMHELGHAWGYQISDCEETYDYDYLSVMHAYYPYIMEDGRGIHAVDALLYRNNYADQASIIAIHDIGTESYWALGILRPASTDSPTYALGSPITFQNVTVENAGTFSESDVRLRFYLSTNTTITTSDYQIGSYVYWTNFGTNSYWTGDYSTTLPMSIPPGEYYVGCITSRNGYGTDDYSLNNNVLFSSRVTINCPSLESPVGCQGSTNRCDGVLLSWSWSGSGHVGFRITRDGTVVYDGLDPNARSWLDLGAGVGAHTYEMAARYEVCGIGPSCNTTGTRSGPPMADPYTCSASTDRCDGVLTNWSWDGSGQNGFKVLRDGILIYTGTSADERSWFDGSCSVGNHAYQILAYNVCGDGPACNVNGIRLGGPSASPYNCSVSTDRCDGVMVSWSWNGSSQSGFKVNRDGILVYTGTNPSERSWFDGNCSVGSHAYQVAAYDACGDGPSCAPAGARLGPPSAPSTCSASDGGYCDRVIVTWSNVGGESGYRLFRNGAQVGPDLPIGTVSYDDFSAVPGTTYQYWVVAFNACGTSPDSPHDAGERLPVPNAPSGCSATDGTLCDRVQVTWSDVEDETAYRVYRDSWPISGDLPPGSVSWDDFTVVPDQTYEYWVLARNACGSSGESPHDSGSRAAESVVVNSPNGSEQWPVGSMQSLAWTATPCIGTVDIELSRNGPQGPWEVLREGEENDGEQPWSVTGPPSLNCFVRIADATDAYPGDLSDLSFAILSSGATYLVRPDGTGDFPTIQDAVDFAEDGDSIELSDGVFVGARNRDIDFLGKAITLGSESGAPESCVIDCQGSTVSARGFLFLSGEGRNSVLEGITIRNGYCISGGSGIWIGVDAAPVVRNCIIRDCWTDESSNGGGVSCVNGSPRFEDCVFIGNGADDGGGGAMYLAGSSAEIVRTQFVDNHGAWDGGTIYIRGGSLFLESSAFTGSNSIYRNGIIMVEDADVTIVDCTFVGNGESAVCIEGRSTDVNLENCTIVGTTGPAEPALEINDGYVTVDRSIIAFSEEGASIECFGTASVTLTCCDVFGNAGGDYVGCIVGQDGVGGNFALDPRFCDWENNEVGLMPASPCAAENNPECEQVGARAIECSAVGICCLEDGSCLERTEDDCASAGGSYGGDGTECIEGSCEERACVATCGVDRGVWTLRALRTIPEDPTASSVFSSLAPDLEIVWNDEGGYYVPDFGLDELSPVEVGNGYQLFVRGQGAIDWEVSGEVPDESTGVLIRANQWNFVPYLSGNCDPTCSVQVTAAFQDIVDCIEEVHDEAGRFWVPEYGLDTIGRLDPRLAYYVYLADGCPDQVVFYPSCTQSALDPPPKPNWPLGVQPTGLCRTFIIAGDEEGLLIEGDLVGIMADGVLVGSTVVTGSLPLLVPVWQADIERGLPGYSVGSRLTAFVRKTNGVQIPVRLLANGTGATFGFPEAHQTVSIAVETVPTNTTLEEGAYASRSTKNQLTSYGLRVEPNPTSGRVRIRYFLPEPSELDVEVFDIAGRSVARLFHSHSVAGEQSLDWDGNDVNGNRVSAGIYFVRMQGSGQGQERRFLVIR